MPRYKRVSRFREFSSIRAERQLGDLQSQADCEERPAYDGRLQIQREYKATGDESGHVLTNPWFILLNGMTRGDDNNQRIGREVLMRSVLLSYSIAVNTVSGLDVRVRVMIVYDRQTNTLAPVITDILNSSNVVSIRNLSNVRRFSILYDVVHVLNSYIEPFGQLYRKYYRHLNHPVVYNSGNAGTVADIVTGSLYLVAFCSTAVDSPTISYAARIRYTDD